jgi:hypothetical protein
MVTAYDADEPSPLFRLSLYQVKALLLVQGLLLALLARS